MNRGHFHILRVGMGIVFLWIAVLIFKSPEGWGAFIQPWAAGVIPIPIKIAMIGTAFLDALIGFLLLVDVGIWVVALVGALHILSVLVVVGITDVTVRDIGLLTAMLTLLYDSLPAGLKGKIIKQE